MSNPPPVNAGMGLAQPDTASDSSADAVFVLGAGFTRAFVPESPLMVDDFGNDDMAEKIIGLPHASRLLEQERKRNHNDLIDIERLMTRLDSLMPYDFGRGAVDEFRLLLSELRKSFRCRIESALQSENVQEEALKKFERNCNKSTSSPSTTMMFSIEPYMKIKEPNGIHRTVTDFSAFLPATSLAPTTQARTNLRQPCFLSSTDQ